MRYKLAKTTFILFIAMVLPLQAVLLLPRDAHALAFGSLVFTQEVPTPVSYVFLKENILDPVSRIMARAVARSFINNSIRWLQTGGQSGPLFVTDFGSFLGRVANDASGEFIHNLGAGNLLCSPFRRQVNLALGTRLGNVNVYQQFNCTIADVIGNVKNSFYGNFYNGGWRAWSRIALPQNNPQGAYLLALDTASAIGQREREARRTEALASGGYLGVRNCEEVPAGLGDDVVDGAGNPVTTKRCKTVTPGTVVHDAISKATNYPLDQLVTVDEINELVTALGDFALQKVFNQSGGSAPHGLLDDNNSSFEGGAGINNSAPVLKNGLKQFTEDGLDIIKDTKKKVEKTVKNITASHKSVIKNGVDGNVIIEELGQEQLWVENFLDNNISNVVTFAGFRKETSRMNTEFKDYLKPLLLDAKLFMPKEKDAEELQATVDRMESRLQVLVITTQ